MDPIRGFNQAGAARFPADPLRDADLDFGPAPIGESVGESIDPFAGFPLGGEHLLDAPDGFNHALDGVEPFVDLDALEAFAGGGLAPAGALADGVDLAALGATLAYYGLDTGFDPAVARGPGVAASDGDDGVDDDVALDPAVTFFEAGALDGIDDSIDVEPDMNTFGAAYARAYGTAGLAGDVFAVGDGAELDMRLETPSGYDFTATATDHVDGLDWATDDVAGAPLPAFMFGFGRTLFEVDDLEPDVLPAIALPEDSPYPDGIDFDAYTYPDLVA